MASAARAMEDDAPTAAPAAKPRGLMLPLLAAVIVSTAASGGVAWFVSQRAVPVAAHAEEAPKPVAKAPASYLPLQPAFVVNLQDDEALRFLQLDVEVMARDAQVIEAVKTHMPRIRNSLLMLFGQQSTAQLVTRADKERLQAQVLAEIQNILKEETGEPGIEAAYFTSFVMQ